MGQPSETLLLSGLNLMYTWLTQRKKKTGKMSVKEYLESKVGQKVGIVRAGFPKEVQTSGKLAKVEFDMAVISDDQKQEWAIPLDKILAVVPCEDEKEKKAGFR